ncbi:MAG: class I SAM-dependent methyltransferase [Gemmatimonadales bacterium]
MPCACSSVSRATARHFGDDWAGEELAAYHRDGPGQTTRRLLAALRSLAARGSLLDVGSGIGVLALELLRAGMASATCVDIAGEALTVGQGEAVRQGVAERITWREGDFVDLAAELPGADAVTLDRVVCCYPDYRPLLEAAAGHCRQLLALSYPRDRWIVRIGLALENLWRRVRRDAFRAYLHSPDAIGRVLQENGLSPVHREETWKWEMRVYGRKRPP